MASPWDDDARQFSNSPLDQLVDLYTNGGAQGGSIGMAHPLDPFAYVDANSGLTPSLQGAPGFSIWPQYSQFSNSPSDPPFDLWTDEGPQSGSIGAAHPLNPFASVDAYPYPYPSVKPSPQGPPGFSTGPRFNGNDPIVTSLPAPGSSVPVSSGDAAQDDGDPYGYASADPFISADQVSQGPLQAGATQLSAVNGVGGSITKVAAPTSLGEIRPSNGFFSYLFGGPVPLTSPAGNTLGYYDHQAADAGLQILGKYAAVAPLFVPGGFLEAFPESGGAKVAGAISDGIEEALEGHHAFPKFMGGPANQDLIALRQSMHRSFHKNLAAALGDAGFPRVGGTGGGAKDWAKYFDKNPGSYDGAVQVLRSVSRDFDRANGTTISLRLDRILSEGARGAPEGAGR